MAEAAPRGVAELDFGRLGLIQDPETGRRRTAWALIVVLAYSRHSFVWPTFSQKLEDVIVGLGGGLGLLRRHPQVPGHRQLRRRGGGCRRAASPGSPGASWNTPSTGASSADPVRVRHPKDKPRVERGVQYVRERFFKGGDFRRPGTPQGRKRHAGAVISPE